MRGISNTPTHKGKSQNDGRQEDEWDMESCATGMKLQLCKHRLQKFAVLRSDWS